MSPRKAKTEPPFFPFYYERWLQSPTVRTLTPAARGVYVDLLCEQATRGILPTDPAHLAAIVGVRGAAWTKIWASLAPLFPAVEGGRRNPSLHDKQTRYAEARLALTTHMAEMGLRSAAVRKSLYGNAQPRTHVRGTPNGASNARSGKPERSVERAPNGASNIPTTHVMGSTSLGVARATRPRPPYSPLPCDAGVVVPPGYDPAQVTRDAMAAVIATIGPAATAAGPGLDPDAETREGAA